MALILDTETNGLPNLKGLFWGDFPDYKNIEKYDTSRIVQFSMMICDNNFNEILQYDAIVKRDKFDICNTEFHGITNEISDMRGKKFIDIAIEFYGILKTIDCIVAHNIAFDINVIKAELYRYELFHIIDEIDKKNLLCTMKHTKPILKIINKYGKYKNPSLNELYTFNFGKNIENAHNSLYDVINLHKVVKHMHDNNTLNFSLY